MTYETKTAALRYAIMHICELPMIRELIGFMSGETAYLYYLHTTKDKETCLSDISRMLGVTKGRITAMTASLSRKEMVSPKTDPEDRRRLILTLTDKGRAFIVTKQQRIDRFLDKYIQTVGEEKTDRVIQTLKDAMDGMKEVAF